MRPDTTDAVELETPTDGPTRPVRDLSREHPTSPDEDDTRNLQALGTLRRNYVATAAAWLAGATDIGRRHHHNQDAIDLRADPSGAQRGVMAVSDGVSSSPHSEIASKIAAENATQQLASRLANGTFTMDHAHEIFTQVFESTNRAVLSGEPGSTVPGSCTLVVAAIDADRAAIGNIGDTRAYWLPDHSPAQQLSTDDSVAQTQMELGMSRREAEAGIHAHAITKWLGPDATDVEPRTVTFRAEEPGWLMVCSDGLWNYCSEAASMATLVGQFWATLGDGSRDLDQDPATLAESLVRWANAQGGRDNISVCLARLVPTHQRD